MTTSLATPIAPATVEQADQAAAVIALAFAADPVVRWTYPDPDAYLRDWPLVVRAFGGEALRHGTGYYAEGFTGAALWLPPGVHPDEEQLDDALRATVAAERLSAIFAMFEQMAAYHPPGPHWYLPLIGVDPAYQGKGIGAALLRPALEEADRERLPAYLESTNPRNLSLYRRHGFEVVGTIQVPGAPPLFPMVRPPG